MEATPGCHLERFLLRAANKYIAPTIAVRILDVTATDDAYPISKTPGLVVPEKKYEYM
jgi:hypothetical protein